MDNITQLTPKKKVNIKKLSLDNMIKYIKQYISDLNIEERQDILQIITNSGIDDKYIQTKGKGTQIRFINIPPEVIKNIYEYIYIHLDMKEQELQYFPTN